MLSDNPSVCITRDLMDPARANALQAALGRNATFDTGDELPPFYHQLYFWDPAPPSGLGRDGHPRVGGLIPDMGLPRRMWAGGQLEFRTPLRAGIAARRVAVREDRRHKTGRSGPLGFVRLRHEIEQDGQLCLREWQDLVYREDPGAQAVSRPAPRARTDETQAETANFSSTLLFRYSALTFNGHRIHYDLDYARDIEGYGGLVVHGPLLAQFLMLMAEAALGPLATFRFRATAPLMHHETAMLCRKGADLWVRAPDGRQCMQAAATAA